MQDLFGDVVMQGSRRDGSQGVTNAEETAGGENDLNDPSGFDVDGKVFHFAEFLVLIIVDRHPNDVAGFGSSVQAIRPAHLAHPVTGIFRLLRFGSGGVLGQCRQRQYRGGSRAGDDLKFTIHLIFISV